MQNAPTPEFRKSIRHRELNSRDILSVALVVSTCADSFFFSFPAGSRVCATATGLVVVVVHLSISRKKPRIKNVYLRLDPEHSSETMSRGKEHNITLLISRPLILF